jgi:hypothetical protein
MKYGKLTNDSLQIIAVIPLEGNGVIMNPRPEDYEEHNQRLLEMGIKEVLSAEMPKIESGFIITETYESTATQIFVMYNVVPVAIAPWMNSENL